MIEACPDLTNSRVVVLGGAGFIGSHVVRALADVGVPEIVVFDNMTRGKLSNLNPVIDDPRVSIFADGGDIRDIDVLRASIRGADVVFHLAAMWLLHSRDYPRTAFSVNVEGTLNVLETCVAESVQKVVFSSSASVYGSAEEIPMTERHPLSNRNFYGASKIAGEQMFRAYFERFGLNYVALRYMNVYGPNQDQQAAYSGVIPLMLNGIDEGKSPIVNGDGSQSYDFVNVEDVARANLLAASSAATDVALNVGTGRETSIRELCETILRLKDSSLPITFLPYSDGDSRQLVQRRVGCTKLAEELIGYRSSVGLEEGLSKLIAWRDSGAASEV